MKEYIDKQELLKELQRDLANDCNVYHSHIGKEIRDEKYEFVIDVIRDAPAADVIENIHAKWIKISGVLTMFFKCSRCGGCHEFATRYCPTCGSKMDLE